MTLGFFSASDGARLAYRDEGQGLPVLALAGLTRTGEDFDYLAPYLKDVRLIRPDYRGRGGSEWTGHTTYTVVQEAADALQLLDHLGIQKAAVLGTSRGGLIGMYLAATARDRVTGLALNDIGPVLEKEGLQRIFDYIGRNPAAKTFEDMARRTAEAQPGFANVPPERWLSEVRHHYVQTDTGLKINYDPELRTAFMTAFEGPLPDAWPLFDLLSGLPLALIKGANSDLLSEATATEMQRRRPDMLFANIADRAHVPFLDEPEALRVINAWLQLIR